MLGTQDGAWGVDTALKTFVWQVWCGRHVCQAAPSVCSQSPEACWWLVRRAEADVCPHGFWLLEEVPRRGLGRVGGTRTKVLTWAG